MHRVHQRMAGKGGDYNWGGVMEFIQSQMNVMRSKEQEWAKEKTQMMEKMIGLEAELNNQLAINSDLVRKLQMYEQHEERQYFGGTSNSGSTRGMSRLNRKAHHTRAKSDLICKENSKSSSPSGRNLDLTQHPVAPTCANVKQTEPVQGAIYQGNNGGSLFKLNAHGNMGKTPSLRGSLVFLKGKEGMGSNQAFKRFEEDLNGASFIGNKTKVAASGLHKSYEINGGQNGKQEEINEAWPNSFRALDKTNQNGNLGREESFGKFIVRGPVQNKGYQNTSIEVQSFGMVSSKGKVTSKVSYATTTGSNEESLPSSLGKNPASVHGQSFMNKPASKAASQKWKPSSSSHKSNFFTALTTVKNDQYEKPEIPKIPNKQVEPAKKSYRETEYNKHVKTQISILQMPSN